MCRFLLVIHRFFTALKNSFFRKLLLKLGFGSSRKPSYGWFGNYSSWQAAREMVGGYEQGNILDKTRQSLLKVKAGEAVYERDSVLFSTKEYPFALIACLLHVATAHQNTLHVTDFGGSLGSTWYQVRDFMNRIKELSWHVVEQDNYVKAGKTDFEDATLKFHYTIEESVAVRKPQVILLSSVIQYLEAPHAFLDQIAKLAPAYILFDRTSIIDAGDDRLTVQRVNPEIYDGSYPSWFFNEKRLLAHFSDYDCITAFSSFVPSEVILHIDGKPLAKDKGFFLKRKS